MRVIGWFMVVFGYMLGVDMLSMWVGSRHIEFRDTPYTLVSIILLFGGIRLIRRSKRNG